MEVTQKGFIEFVQNQDSHREIDHSNWGDCAVGDYLSHIECTSETPYSFANYVLDWELMQALGGDQPQIVGDTYGEFQIFLDENGYFG